MTDFNIIPPNRPFSIMCKPVCGMCNLDCKYCYYTMKPHELYPGEHKFLMSDEVLDAYVSQYIQAQPIRCEFGWQGGEPTLAGLDFFRKVVELQRKYQKPGQTITNSLQTNGTLLDDDWAKFLADENFLVGISLDGPPQWHDKFRRDHNDKPTYHKAWRGVELCKKYGVEFNILVTLNSMNAPHASDIYRYFVNKGIEYVQFIPILERKPDGTPTEFSCRPEQFAKFMLEVFDLWASRDVGVISERLIDSVLHTLIFGRASTCCYAERCANAHIVEWNGDFYACDHFVQSKWKIGNILETPISELAMHPKLDEFAKLKTELPAKCTECEFVNFCFGGCPKHHVQIGTDPERYNYFCEGLKEFFAKAVPILKKMAPYIARGETPPAICSQTGNTKPPKRQSGMPTREAAAALQAQQQFQNQMQPPAQGGQTGSETGNYSAPVKPGRNDPCPCGSGRKFKKCCGKDA